MNDTNTSGDDGFLQRIKESPRTVSALIIILIVAAAIYAFSGQKNQTSSEATESPSGTAAEATPAPGASEAPATAATSPTPLPEATRDSAGFVEVAQRGEGLTHLARRSADTWLKENQAGYDVTAEHRIYIEDYIQKKLGSRRMEIGQQQAIPYDLVAEAVASAKNLSPSQLKHLTHYTHTAHLPG